MALPSQEEVTLRRSRPRRDGYPLRRAPDFVVRMVAIGQSSTDSIVARPSPEGARVFSRPHHCRAAFGGLAPCPVACPSWGAAVPRPGPPAAARPWGECHVRRSRGGPAGLEPTILLDSRRRCSPAARRTASRGVCFTTPLPFADRFHRFAPSCIPSGTPRAVILPAAVRPRRKGFCGPFFGAFRHFLNARDIARFRRIVARTG